MERLAEAVRLAAKYHQESFQKLPPVCVDGIMISQSKYSVSFMEAAERAAAEVGYDERGTVPVYLLLSCAWNDILDWAEGYDNPLAQEQDFEDIDPSTEAIDMDDLPEPE